MSWGHLTARQALLSVGQFQMVRQSVQMALRVGMSLAAAMIDLLVTQAAQDLRVLEKQIYLMVTQVVQDARQDQQRDFAGAESLQCLRFVKQRQAQESRNEEYRSSVERHGMEVPLRLLCPSLV